MWGQHLLPHLQHTLKEILSPETSIEIFNDALFPLSARSDLCLALLAASELPGKWKDEALRNVRHISKNTSDMSIALSTACRESTRLRVKGDTSGSKILLQETTRRFTDTTQPSQSLRAVLGSLTVSEALNYVQEEKLSDAITRLNVWSPLDPNEPSTLERVVLVNIQAQLAKVLRYQGRFDEALQYLENLHEVTTEGSLFEDIRADIANEFGNVLTEKNRPDKAQEILYAEIDNQKRKGRSDTAASKLLHLSLAETFMRQGNIEVANDYYTGLSNLSPFADLCHNVGLARVAHANLDWPVAINHWTDALKILAKHFPQGDSHNGHTSLGILQSMHVALLNSGYEGLGRQTLEQITDIDAICAPNGCKHWIPGLNSYWIDSVRGFILRRSASL
jgi:tetratricopeptide (TPR) repeat protein